MIAFRLSTSGHLEWTQDGGRTWYPHDQPMPATAFRSWWQFLKAVEAHGRLKETAYA